MISSSSSPVSDFSDSEAFAPASLSASKLTAPVCENYEAVLRDLYRWNMRSKEGPLAPKTNNENMLAVA